MQDTKTREVTEHDLDVDQDTRDELSARADMAERQHHRSRSHAIAWMSDAGDMWRSICGRYFTAGRPCTHVHDRCISCEAIQAERIMKGI